MYHQPEEDELQDEMEDIEGDKDRIEDYDTKDHSNDNVLRSEIDNNPYIT
jgi:hypothetical protein